jgi:monoamine oxidase
VCPQFIVTLWFIFNGELMLDCIIIGAGAAGVAAGRALQAAGQQIVILEARDRIGGRAWTETTPAGYPLELGAEFIHGEHVITHRLLHEAGMYALPAERAALQHWLLDMDVHHPAEQQTRLRPMTELPEPLQSQWAAIEAAYAALKTQPPATDCSLQDYLAGRGLLTAPGLETMADVLLAQTCCARLDQLSSADLAREMQVDQAGRQEFRLEQGYAALFAWLSHDLDIRLNEVVRGIYWGPNPAVQTERALLHARAILVTVPVALLAAGEIQFIPALPPAKQAAIAAFRTEPATKLIYQFRQRRWADEQAYLCQPGLTARWWTPGEGRPDAPALITAYLTADRARQIDSLPEADALALGLRELSSLLDQPLETLQADLRMARRVSWAGDPYARGGYAHLPPGQAGARPALAAPLGGSLFFAGEATAWHSNPQTVHGAFESGLRAAGEILQGL